LQARQRFCAGFVFITAGFISAKITKNYEDMQVFANGYIQL